MRPSGMKRETTIRTAASAHSPRARASGFRSIAKANETVSMTGSIAKEG